MCKNHVFIPITLRLEMIQKLNSDCIPIKKYLETMSPLDEQKLHLLEDLVKLNTFENQEERNKAVDVMWNKANEEWENCTFYRAQIEDYQSAVQRIDG